MNIQYRLRGLHNNPGLNQIIEKELQALNSLIPIADAEVVIEQQPDSAPPFLVSALLAVPGPDIHAIGCDHTLQAAWRKLAEDLKMQFQRRTMQRQLRIKARKGSCRSVASQQARAS